VGAVVTGLE